MKARKAGKVQGSLNKSEGENSHAKTRRRKEEEKEKKKEVCGISSLSSYSFSLFFPSSRLCGFA
jgi:hypothetical protein